ncbi:Transcriptional regulator [Photobacterium marinum]|uniref:Transcriptional regulator n=1 Tax=Photobacterium marinum TaxID=1056511 RepID=L8JAX6_9GAMM|nr:TetR/AcrR family transcriptional regulator [Photobacterium marinum]ELR65951.1 Transcriptional regulator [Photobacterium marinum]
MARVTPEESQKTRQKITDAVISCLLDPQIGYEKMTYSRIQSITGLSRGGILNHFNKKEEFLSVLDGKLFDTILTSLDFSSREAFIESFEAANQKPEFKAVLLLLITNLSCDITSQKALESWIKLEQLIEDKLGTPVKEYDLPRLLGRSCSMIVTS